MFWLFGKLRPFKGRVLIALTALVVSAFAWLALGQGVRVVVDKGFVAGDTATLNTMMLVVLAIILVGSLAAYVGKRGRREYFLTTLIEKGDGGNIF